MRLALIIKHINGKIHGNFWITQETHTIRQEIVSKDMQPDDIIVENGNPSVLHLKIENNNGFTALLSQDDKVNVSIHMHTLSAPVLSGETVGEVRAYINDEKFTATPIHSCKYY